MQHSWFILKSYCLKPVKIGARCFDMFKPTIWLKSSFIQLKNIHLKNIFEIFIFLCQLTMDDKPQTLLNGEPSFLSATMCPYTSSLLWCVQCHPLPKFHCCAKAGAVLSVTAMSGHCHPVLGLLNTLEFLSAWLDALPPPAHFICPQQGPQCPRVFQMLWFLSNFSYSIIGSCSCDFFSK